MYDYTIIGAGIVGLSVGRILSQKHPGSNILILEKESRHSCHQTGRNSGVIHSGIYYQPGSLKAQLARQGNREMVQFCRQHGIEHRMCGKVIVAVNDNERPLLEHLYERGKSNQLDVKKITKDELKEIEPHVNGVEAIQVPSTGIVNYQQVGEVFLDTIKKGGGDISYETEVTDIDESENKVTIHTNKGQFNSRVLVNCAGLFSDRMAAKAQVKTDMKIIPFRGEYYELAPEKRELVKHLIYPVPNPKFPFLGVHFSRMIDNKVFIGPNAVLSLKREGYSKTDFNLRDFIESMTYPGLWKLMSKNMGEGFKELKRSFIKNALLKEVQRFIPDINSEDLIPAKSGVRAQALTSSGQLMDDFHIIPSGHTVHVCNAPSPAATASIEIGKTIVRFIEQEILSANQTKRID